MNRVRYALAATLVGALGVGGSTLFAQETKAPAPETKAPEFKSVLAGKKFTPPVRRNGLLQPSTNPVGIKPVFARVD